MALAGADQGFAANPTVVVRQDGMQVHRANRHDLTSEPALVAVSGLPAAFKRNTLLDARCEGHALVVHAHVHLLTGRHLRVLQG